MSVDGGDRREDDRTGKRKEKRRDGAAYAAGPLGGSAKSTGRVVLGWEGGERVEM